MLVYRLNGTMNCDDRSGVVQAIHGKTYEGSVALQKSRLSGREGSTGACQESRIHLSSVNQPGVSESFHRTNKRMFYFSRAVRLLYGCKQAGMFTDTQANRKESKA
jgi:hypothetical protein